MRPRSLIFQPIACVLPSDLAATLKYISLVGLIELNLAAGCARDESDVVELIRANADQVASLREHLASVHPRYVSQFDVLAAKAAEQTVD